MSEKLLKAARDMDWEQVRLNGGPPCFHLEDGRFCGRAERWAGHGTDHDYVSLADLLQSSEAHTRDVALAVGMAVVRLLSEREGIDEAEMTAIVEREMTKP